MFKIFHVKNFHGLHSPRKVFTDNIFPDYGSYLCHGIDYFYISNFQYYRVKHVRQLNIKMIVGSQGHALEY